jgi:hypothetical protein
MAWADARGSSFLTFRFMSSIAVITGFHASVKSATTSYTCRYS